MLWQHGVLKKFDLVSFHLILARKSYNKKQQRATALWAFEKLPFTNHTAIRCIFATLQVVLSCS
jgi:hypothetical protein